jgi:phytoene synthase
MGSGRLGRRWITRQSLVDDGLFTGGRIAGGFDLRSSEQYCRQMTRREARNFYWGFVALPRPKRIAIYALYSFAREIDDDVDLPGGGGLIRYASTGPARYEDTFAKHRERVRRCYEGDATDPVMHVLAHAVKRYNIPSDDLEALIRGVEMDVVTTRYASWDALHVYCNHVASAVGRMCVRVFGYTDPVALTFADDLGVALQLTNILRDVREDLDLGRIYLPQDELRRFGVSEDALLAGRPGRGWDPLVRHQIARAQEYFNSGLRVIGPIPRRATACVLTMAGIYRAILDQIADDPYLPLKTRASLGGRAKLSVMLKSWLQAA